MLSVFLLKLKFIINRIKDGDGRIFFLWINKLYSKNNLFKQKLSKTKRSNSNKKKHLLQK